MSELMLRGACSGAEGTETDVCSAPTMAKDPSPRAGILWGQGIAILS